VLPVPVEEGVTPELAQVAGAAYPASMEVQRTLGDMIGRLIVNSSGAMWTHEDSIGSQNGRFTGARRRVMSGGDARMSAPTAIPAQARA